MKQPPIVLLLLLPFITGFSWLLLIGPVWSSWQADLLRQQQQSLETATAAVASMLAGDPEFSAFAADEPSGSYRSVAITQTIVLDGRDTDWPVGDAVEPGIEHLLDIQFPYTERSLRVSQRMGSDDQFVYLYFEVSDDFVVYRQLGQFSVHRNDHIRLALRDADGDFRRYTLSAQQPGEVSVAEVASNGRALRLADQFSGRWMATQAGYNVEIRFPRELLGDGFSAAVADVDDDTDREIRYLMGLSHTRSAEELGTLVFSPTVMEKVLSNLPYELMIAVADKPVFQSDGFSALAGEIEAAAAIAQPDSPLAVLRIRQSGSAAQSAFDLLQRQSVWVFTLTLLFVGLASALAIWLVYRRFDQLRDKLAAQVDARGRILTRPEPLASADRISQLSRELTITMNRSAQYTDYLERMASRLNHELRTPVSVVKSSLENLQAQLTDPSQTVYVDRASLGVERLTNIMNKMAEARRLEEALDEEEIIRFDLAELVRGCVAGYEMAFPDVTIELNIEASEVPVTGIPELLAQLLDKLVGNAVEFSTTTVLRIRLHVEGEMALLRVINDGPNLPETDMGQLFESMVSVRAEQSGSHLGLGLYIARVISDFHGATLSLGNREDSPGVIATLSIPLLRITAKLR